MSAHIRLNAWFIVSTLGWLLLAAPAQVFAKSEVSDSDVSVSERWDMQLPLESVRQGIEVIPLENGDFLIARLRKTDGEPLVATTFFGRKTAKTANFSWAEKTFVTFQDGSNAQGQSRKEALQDIWQFSRKSGLWMSEANAWRTVPNEGCYFGPLSHNIRLSHDRFALSKDAQTKAIAIFQIAKKSTQRRVFGCPYGEDEKLKIRLSTMQMTGAWALADGGFLVLLDRKLLIRFDQNLQTKSHLLGKTIFIADVPTELVGSQVEHLLEMPILAHMNSKCVNSHAACTLQILHDELLNILLDPNTGSK